MIKMQDSGIQWIGEIPKSWKIKRIKTIFSERKEKNNPQKTNFILSLGASYGVIPYDEKEIGGNKAKEELTDYNLAYPNDIVINSMNIISGSVGISKYFGCVSPVYYILISRSHLYIPKYFCYTFKTKEFQRSLIGLGNGILMKESKSGNFNTVRMKIPMEKLGIQMIAVPPKDEQQKIANFLDCKCDEIDNIISKTKSTIEEYKKLKQSVITTAVTKGIIPNRPMKDSGIQWIEEIPQEWKISKIKYISIFQPTCDISHLNQDSIITYTPMEYIKNGYYVENNTRFGSISSSLTPYSEGDIVIAKVTPCFENGNIAIMNNLSSRFGMGSSELFVLRAKYINTKFLFYWLQNKNFIEISRSTMTGTGGLKRVSPYFIKNCLICVPNETEQYEIVLYLDEKCSEIDNLIQKKEQLLTELENYKKSLIYEYVTGKKEIL